MFALSEAGGPLVDLGPAVSDRPDDLCRAELRIDSPAGPWSVRLASRIYDEPAAHLWDTAGLLVVRYGFHVYGLRSRTGESAWIVASATPVLAVLGSSRMDHVIAVAEIETMAIGADGHIAWRVGQSDVVSAAELVGGRLVLTGYTGEVVALDPATGRTIG